MRISSHRPPAEDHVTSRFLTADGQRPEDYLEAFARYVRENREQVEAIGIRLDRPKDRSVDALRELRNNLTQSRRYTERRLQEAHRIRYQRAPVDVISMVKHAADEDQPLLTADQRVRRALAKLSDDQTFTDEQRKWLDLIGQALRENCRWSPTTSVSCRCSNAPAASARPVAPSARTSTSSCVT